MRFLADENVPLASVERLRAAGHDVRRVPAGSSDTTALALSKNERRVILTFDRDFGTLVFRHELPAPPGVVYFRAVPRTPEHPAMLLLALLENGRVPIENCFTVIEIDRIRQRPLPGA